MSLTNGSRIGIRVIYEKRTGIYTIAECIYSPDSKCQFGCNICRYSEHKLAERGIRGKSSCSRYIYKYILKDYDGPKNICSNSLHDLKMVYAIRLVFNYKNMNLFSSRYLYNNIDKIIVK